MQKLKIEKGTDNKILRTKSEKAGRAAHLKCGMNLADFAKNMKEVLDSEKGLGLSAPQVGENVRICLCRFNTGTPNEVLFVLVNPEITWMSEECEVGVEGCLSLPGYYVGVSRAKEVTVKFLDGRGLLKGKGGALRNGMVIGKKMSWVKGSLPEMTLNLSGLNARLVQHELDHLNGVLICDKAVDAAEKV